MTDEQTQIPYTAMQSLGNGRVLLLAPHPDDEVFGCAGTLVRHAEAQNPIRVVIVTDGDVQAPTDTAHAPDEPPRRVESRAAAAVLGYGEPEFWGLPDRGLAYGEPLIKRIVQAIEDFSADLVYAPSPMEIHPDHRALGLAAIEAVRRVGGERELVLYEVAIPLTPNRLLDITDLLERKREAMHCFPSQLVHQDYSRHVVALNEYRSFTLPPQVRAAEAYHLIPAEALRHHLVALTGPFYQHPQARAAGTDEPDIPLVSVMIRSIGRRELREALDSVALQTHPRIEVIVVNAKGDGHPALPDTCGPFALRLAGAGRPLDRSQAANAGLDAATGDYLVFLDDDDLFYPDHVAGLVETARQNGADAVYAGVAVEHYQDGRQVGEGEFNHPFDPVRLKAENYIPMHALLFSRRFVERGCRFDEGMERYEDWDFWLQLLTFGPFVHRDAISACYRSHGASGFGLRPDEQIVHRQKSLLLDKWRQRWTGDELAEVYAFFGASAAIARENDQLRRQLQAQTDRLGRQEERLSAFDARWQNQQDAAKQLGACKRQTAHLERELQAILHSRSWRLTHPLRWLLNGLRKKPAPR